MTTYHVSYRLRSTGTLHERVFESLLEREMLVILLTPYADIVREWLA